MMFNEPSVGVCNCETVLVASTLLGRILAGIICEAMQLLNFQENKP